MLSRGMETWPPNHTDFQFSIDEVSWFLELFEKYLSDPSNNIFSIYDDYYLLSTLLYLVNVNKYIWYLLWVVYPHFAEAEEPW